MNVFVVVDHQIEADIVHAVFSTKKMANAYIRANKKHFDHAEAEKFTVDSPARGKFINDK